MISHAEVQAALSARLDGEPTGVDNAVIEAHLEQCEECRGFWERSLTLSRSLSVVDADGMMSPPKDLSDVIVAGVEQEFRKLAARRAVALSFGRVIVVALAIVHFVWAARLVMQTGGLTPLRPDPSAGGDVYALEADPRLASLLVGAAAVRIGIGAALLLACWKPNQIPGVLLIVGAMFGFTLGFAVLDAVSGAGGGYGAHVATMFATCAALVFMWVVERGPVNPLRRLGANPV